MREFFPVCHELSGQVVAAGQRHQGLCPVVEVFAQHLVLVALGPVEGEVEETVRLHDPPDVRQALLDDLGRGVREHAVRVHHVEVPGRQERQLQVLDQGQVRQLVLQADLGQRALCGQQDVGGDVDPVVVARVQVVEREGAAAPSSL